jgi:hypothetical protein
VFILLTDFAIATDWFPVLVSDNIRDCCDHMHARRILCCIKFECVNNIDVEVMNVLCE